MTAFAGACAALERSLAGDLRQVLAADAAAAANLGSALRAVGRSMRSHRWGAGADLDFAGFVHDYDWRTRAEGLHVLHDWDGKGDRINEDGIPLDVLEFIVRLRGAELAAAGTAAILIDYYFLYLLALLAVRIWDEGDADANLDAVGRLLAHLQGPRGSGQRFAARAETLFLIATSHYEPHERGYDLLLERVRTLNAPHRLGVAIAHAAALGCHLRFGFEAAYGRSTPLMRDDNVADYPWLCFSLATLMQEYARPTDEGMPPASIAEATLYGLSADARAFVGEPPASLASCVAERTLFRDLFVQHKAELLDSFGRYRPSDRGYSPLSFFYNFSHNVQKGTVVDAILRGRPWPLAVDDMLTAGASGNEGDDSRTRLATVLMDYARSAPDRIRGRLTPVIVYDPAAGRMSFSVTMQKLRQ